MTKYWFSSKAGYILTKFSKIAPLDLNVKIVSLGVIIKVIIFNRTNDKLFVLFYIKC